MQNPDNDQRAEILRMDGRMAVHVRFLGSGAAATVSLNDVCGIEFDPALTKTGADVSIRFKPSLCVWSGMDEDDVVV